MGEAAAGDGAETMARGTARRAGFGYREMNNRIGRQDLVGIRNAVEADPDVLDERSPPGPRGSAVDPSLLIFAIESGALRDLDRLIGLGANVDAHCRGRRFTPLTLACKKGLLEKVQLLLERGAKVDLTDRRGETALYVACTSGRGEIARLLLERGANVDLRQDGRGETALMMACAMGHYMIAQLLLERGAEVDLRNKRGETALMRASTCDRTEIVQLLLERSAKVNLQAKNGRTALMLLAASHPLSAEVTSCETAKLLCDHGARLDLQDSHGRTALTLASGRRNKNYYSSLKDVNKYVKRNMGLAALLVDSGAHIDLAHIPNVQARAALTIACQNGFLEVLELLRAPIRKWKYSKRRARRLRLDDGPALSGSRTKRTKKHPTAVAAPQGPHIVPM